MDAVRILVVDDETLNLEILAEYFGFDNEPPFSPLCIDGGEAAWDVLQDPAQHFDIILLDRMMPGLDGIALLRRIKSEPRLAEIPVILQTAADSAEQIREGLEAGAYYYLTKPYRRDALLAIVQAALTDARARDSLRRRLDEHVGSLQFLARADFRFRNIEEAGQLAAFLAQACPNPDQAILGISELLINAVEHGNLGLGYADKSRLKREDTWQAEISRRLADPANADKEVAVGFERQASGVTLRVVDQGNGFPWQNFLQISPERACDPNGRGIALAGMLSFSSLRYEGCGNIAVATISSAPHTS
jgi:DNA-binding response OmpR family regulator/anti-sigma regulatory factor (Ser/Thr protein kinase)